MDVWPAQGLGPRPKISKMVGAVSRETEAWARALGPNSKTRLHRIF
jgi:hypothetical protein